MLEPSRAAILRRVPVLIALQAALASPFGTALAGGTVEGGDSHASTVGCLGADPSRGSVSMRDCYLPGFFKAYRPLNALDMVNQLPGFKLANGDGSRGFGGAAGNILINGRRPAAKQDRPEDILRRTAVSRVMRIEMIRSGTSGVNMGGHPRLANMVLSNDAAPAVNWEVMLRHNLEHGGAMPEGRFALSSAWRGIDYTLGAGARRFAHGELGSERVGDGVAIRELRSDRADTNGGELRGNFGAAWWNGDARFTLTSDRRCEDRGELRSSDRMYRNGSGPREILFGHDQGWCRAELGVTAEKPVTEMLSLEVMAIVNHTGKDILSTEAALSTGVTEYRLSDATRNRASEGIARLELDWSGMPGHTVRSTLELTTNRMWNELVRTVNSGGDIRVLPVPGANRTIDEFRTDIFVGDVWANGGLAVDLGIGAETSRLTQVGDVALERSFTYLKPAAGFALSLDDRTRWRMRLAREASQLDFENFVTETNLEDGVVVPGNPDLRPEVHWVAEVGLNRRFGASGTLDVTGFHHWISDVEDQLPVTTTSTATGNIGGGRRWGVDLGATLPLDLLGIEGARLDVTGRWQDSSVIDPVTGRERVLSDEREYDVTIEYRHDLKAANVAWGGRVRMLAAKPLFKANEHDVNDEGNDVQLFVETVRWGGVKLRFTVDDVFNRCHTRERRVYGGERHFAPLLSHERRRHRGGRRVTVGLSGTF